LGKLREAPEENKQKGGLIMTMIRWEPFREMMSLRNTMDRLFDERFIRPSYLWPELERGDLPVDMYQTANDVIIKAALPGIKPEEVDISITGDVLTIKGDHKEDQERKKEDYFYKEHRYGSFSRSIPLLVRVKSDKAEAIFENGILTLTLPKAEEVKPKQIKVKVKGMIEGAKK
jgi:HSP20 family protein